jgi:hypothetical protein
MRSYVAQSVISLFNKSRGDRIYPTFLCRACGWSNDRLLKKARKKATGERVKIPGAFRGARPSPDRGRRPQSHG